MIPLIFGDSQALAANYLRPLLGVPVGTRVPSPRPTRFVTLRRSGGLRGVVTDEPRLDFFAWAATDEAAHDLIQDVCRHLAAMPGTRDGVLVKSVDEFAGPIPAPDPSGQPRWLVTWEITLRGAAA